MAQVGQFALTLAFVVTVYAIAASLLGARARNDKLIASGRNAAVGACMAVTAAMLALAYQFITNDFTNKYVASHSNVDLPVYFKISSLWGGQEGSLLFWGWLLAVYAAIVVIQNRRKHTAMMPYVTATLMTTSLFFTFMHLFVVNPFALSALERGDGVVGLFTPVDGAGLNPLLQDALMVIHPPMLYLGFVGFSVPFAFAMAALMTRQLGDTWIRTTRRWTMVAWLFLGIGILLGGRWAYYELGWGGFWAWDPVENASLMPWLVATAFLHSVMVQEKKGMLKVWNMVLVILTYVLCIFGTFLTRSGIVSSVHAFAQSPIGGYFLAFIVVSLSVSLYLVVDRLTYLKSESQMDSLVSRESSFLFNNLLLLASCFAVFWGTMLPVFSEWITGDQLTVSSPFFNRVNVPLAVMLLFLTGVGPLLAWRKASTNSLKRNFMIPAIVSLATGVGMYFAGVTHFYAWISLVLCLFVAITIVREFYKGARARAAGSGEGFAEAVFNLTMRNTRRYGGYIAHFGFVLLFMGWSGMAFVTEAQVEAEIGGTFAVRQYVFALDDIRFLAAPNYEASRADISLYEYGRKVAVMHPERRLYSTAEEQMTTEVALRSTLKEDVYVAFQGTTADGSRAIFHVFVNPLVMWVWLGGIVLALGTLIGLLPNKQMPPRRAGAPAAGREVRPVTEGQEGQNVEQSIS